jgi:hypothetical protein
MGTMISALADSARIIERKGSCNGDHGQYLVETKKTGYRQSTFIIGEITDYAGEGI